MGSLDPDPPVADLAALERPPSADHLALSTIRFMPPLPAELYTTPSYSPFARRSASQAGSPAARMSAWVMLEMPSM